MTHTDTAAAIIAALSTGAHYIGAGNTESDYVLGGIVSAAEKGAFDSAAGNAAYAIAWADGSGRWSAPIAHALRAVASEGRDAVARLVGLVAETSAGTSTAAYAARAAEVLAA